MIRFENVSKIYDGQRRAALEDVNVDIDKGEFVFLVGASGSGKSTFLRLILREQRPTKGKVFVAGRELNKLHSWKIPAMRRQIGTVFQDFRLLPNKTVTDNVAFALQVIGKPSSTIRRVVPEVLELVGLQGKGGRLPEELSGGEQQRVAIARAFVNRPMILIADEPTGNLDPGDERRHHEAAGPDQPGGHHRADGHPRLDDRRPDAQAGDRARRRGRGPRPEPRCVRLPVSRRSRPDPPTSPNRPYDTEP